MITLSLLHPFEPVPVQSWTFESESVIRIGRSTDNDVVIYSAVVSRHHVELQRNPNGWEVVALGSNGTYVDKESLTRTRILDGMVIRLASSGPKIQIWIGSAAAEARLKTSAFRSVSSKSANDPSQKVKTLLTGPKPSQITDPTTLED